MRRSVISTPVQRDPRTSLDLKRSYVWTGFIACILAFIVSALMFDLYSKYTQNNGAGIFFVIVSVGLMIFSLVLGVVNMIAINQENYMWMTTKLSGGQCIGRDDLDCDPLAFDNFTEAITQKTFEDKSRFNQVWNDAHLSTLRPHFTPVTL